MITPLEWFNQLFACNPLPTTHHHKNQQCHHHPQYPVAFNPAVDASTQLYAICHIDFKRHYNRVKHFTHPQYLVDDVLTSNTVVEELWSTLLDEMTHMFVFLLSHPSVVHQNSQIIDVMVQKNVRCYIATMLMCVNQSIPQVSRDGVESLKRELFQPLYLYIHQCNVLVGSNVTLDSFYNVISQAGLVQLNARYTLDASVGTMIADNHLGILDTFNGIVTDVTPLDKLLTIQSTIDLVSMFYSIANQLCTADLLLSAMAHVVYFAKVPLLVVDLKFCKDYGDSPDSKLQFCFTTLEAITIDILLHYGSDMN